MSLFVDTSVWSLAWRRDVAPSAPEIRELKRGLEAGESIYATGIVLQELLQGFSRPKDHTKIIEHFSSLPLLVPDRQDHIYPPLVGFSESSVRSACPRARQRDE